MTLVLALLAGCGVSPGSDGPVPWRGEATNSLLPDDDGADDEGTDDEGTDDDGADDDGTDDDGDGTDDGGDPSPEPEPEPEPEPAPDPDGWPAGHVAVEDEMLRLVNAFRETGGDCPSGTFGPRAPLRMDPALRRAARLHSADMAENNYFSHTSQDGRSAWQRMGDAGYTGQPAAENIAAGNRTAAATFEQWRRRSRWCSSTRRCAPAPASSWAPSSWAATRSCCSRARTPGRSSSTSAR
jgi:hypothetical protein